MVSLSMRRWLSLPAVLVLLIFMVVVAASPMAATVPGRDGLIAFAATTGRGVDIYTVRPNGTALHRVTWSGTSRDPAWAPHGHRMLYTRGDDIWIMGAGGRHKARVIRDGSDPSWSPNGSRFVFVSARSGMWELWIYTFATRQSVQLTPNGGPAGPWAYAPSWSPRGNRIAFSSGRWESGNPYCPEIYLYTIRPDGRGATVVTHSDTVIAEEGASWAPGGQRIVWDLTFVGGEGCEPFTHTLIVQSLGGYIYRKIQTVGDTNPAWSPSGRWIATARSVDTWSDVPANRKKPGLWLRRPDGSRAHRIVFGSRSLDIQDVGWAPAPAG